MIFTLLFAACGTADTGDTGGADDGAATSPRHPDAEWTAEEAAAEMKEGFRLGVPMTPPLVSTFMDMVSHGDELCPGPDYTQFILSVYESSGCSSASGYWYQGAGGAGAGWYDFDGDGFLDFYMESMKVDGSMRDPGGNTFEFGGAVIFEFDGDPVAGGTFEAEFLGTYHYPVSSSLWLQAGSSSALYMSGSIGADGMWTAEASGGFAVDGRPISLSDFTINGACGQFPTGTVGVRDAVGYWYDLTYDETTCDGCGEVVFDRRESLGRACFDATLGMMSSLLEIQASMQDAIGGTP